MKNSHRFFENRDCGYYPCHEGIDELNCLFCYCPLYHMRDCPGHPSFNVKNGREIKACSGCDFPHRPEHYEEVVRLLKECSR